jgi:hypothetical protein
MYNRSNQKNMKTKILAVTIQENESNIYEYNEGKLLFNSTIDNDMTTSHEEAKENWNEFATGRGKIVGGNEGQWKADVHKHILRYTFIGLVELYKTAEISGYKDIVIFYSSNTSKDDLEEQVKHFQTNHHGVDIQIVGKNMVGHEAVLHGVEKILEA